MRVLYCALLMALIGMPGLAAAAETPSNRELTKKLDALESRVERLERREKSETKAEKKAEKRAEARAKEKEKDKK
jgi:uncharacterized membrane protein YukC